VLKSGASWALGWQRTARIDRLLSAVVEADCRGSHSVLGFVGVLLPPAGIFCDQGQGTTSTYLHVSELYVHNTV
jgi:hypothetical protein